MKTQMSVEDKIMAARRLWRDKIVASPGSFKVCYGCDSVMAAPAALCNICHTYSFDRDTTAVVEAAKRLGSQLPEFDFGL
jgi:RNA polymerase subunit RPABC4/transcription elongation factor Spt4